MKILFSSNKNPHFFTITEYIEKALRRVATQVIFFDDMDFIIPGRIRDRLPYLSMLDLKRINKLLLSKIRELKPDLFLVAGGHRILPDTVAAIKREGVKTALWTIDVPQNFEPILASAPYYDGTFTGGSEAYDILKDAGVTNLHWLPFGCDPDFHRPQKVTDSEARLYGCDIAFAGTVDPDLYPGRFQLLEAISDYDLGVWGPGSEKIPASSPLRKKIRGAHTVPEVWTKIYSQAKIVLCIHYNDPAGVIPCHQASPRVYEALACGTFLMVDGQKDVFALFKNREDLVVFSDLVELRDLISYYLQRPGERQRIAKTGRAKALAGHTYQHRISKLFEIVCQA